MRTVHEVSRLTGVSIRTLQYYDQIGLLRPAGYTEAGYRLYDDASLERLQQILLFRELEFPLKEIRRILAVPDFDKGKALEQQIALLTLKKEHLENLIGLAREIKTSGENRKMSFDAFDTRKMDEYAAQAKASWGKTPEYHEYEQKAAGRTPRENAELGSRMMDIFAELGTLRSGDPASEEAQALIRKLRDFITAHYYTCTKEILLQLGLMYTAGGEMTDNIDHAGGKGTAAFTNDAIKVFCAE